MNNNENGANNAVDNNIQPKEGIINHQPENNPAQMPVTNIEPTTSSYDTLDVAPTDNIPTTETIQVEEDKKEETTSGVIPSGQNKNTGPSKGNIAVMVIIFIILIVLIVGLPYLVEYIENLDLNSNTNNTSISSNSEDTSSEENPIIEPETKYYNISSTEKVTLENMTINDINLSYVETDDYYVTINITNSSQNRLELGNENYYIELYNEDKTLIERVKLDGIIYPDNSSSKKYYVKETSLNASLYTIVTKQDIDYPGVTLSKDSDGNDVLTCTNGGNTIIYSFNGTKLKTIKDSYFLVLNETNTVKFNEKQTHYQTLASNYATIEGVSTGWASSPTSFSFTSEVEPTKAAISATENDYYYELDTEAKVINFEMNSRRFTCS